MSRFSLLRFLLCLLLAGLLPSWPADNDAQALPAGAAKETVIKVCTACHDTGKFRKLRLTVDDWSDKVADMVDRGAQASDDDAKAIAAYLTANFGPDSKLRVNTAPMLELKAVLGITAQQAQALTAWREANGNFRKWQDLSKALGADGGKIESKKDLMVF